MEKIKILYVDNRPDNYLTRYLRERCVSNEFNKDVEFDYEEMPFGEDYTIEGLMHLKSIEESNVIIIDSSLFDDSSKTVTFSGEDFKAVFKKVFPFAEVIVITQHDIKDVDYQTVVKFKARKVKETSNHYYDTHLKPKIESSVKNIVELRHIIAKMKNSNDFNGVLVEKLDNLLKGISDYNELDKNDIDKIINLFKNIQRHYE